MFPCQFRVITINAICDESFSRSPSGTRLIESLRWFSANGLLHIHGRFEDRVSEHWTDWDDIQLAPEQETYGKARLQICFRLDA
jgi:hypothetical protein